VSAMGERFDVAVIGGGPVGSALALELVRGGFSVALVEARASGAQHDTRPLALSYGSRLILERLGVWEALAQPTPITTIHISQGGGFGRTVLTAGELALPALGYVVDYAGLVSALDACIERSGVHAVRGASVETVREVDGRAKLCWSSAAAPGSCRASLVAIADGSALAAATQVRVQDYGQSAVSARVEVTLPHRNVAYERFTPEGPLALLPSGDEYAVVWSVTSRRAELLCKLEQRDFLAALQRDFGERAGRFTRVRARAAHSLVLRVAEHTAIPRSVLIGNAAQALHPVAGQGFNLGLRDAWELARQARRSGVDDSRLQEAFRARRGLDRAGGVAFTDALVKIFSNDSRPLGFARGVGLTLLDCLPPAKDFIARRMIFGARAW
jgi:2-octaprenyl-6-methoxyphenol hydroxylase